MITGGAGFIGTHVVQQFLIEHPEYEIYNIDKLTYAANPATAHRFDSFPHYHFIQRDICDVDEKFLEKYQIDGIIHLAAESHVDNSITNPGEFIRTNVNGTFALMEAARKYWNGDTNCRFYYVSTDEVFGDLPIYEPYTINGVRRFGSDIFNEDSQYNPSSPYSASKAAGDHLVRSYHRTYGMNTVISNCTNNYGPFQHPEKLLPKLITNYINMKTLPLYGKGENVRDWLYVEDHARAIDLIFHKAVSGSTYFISGDCEMMNKEIIKQTVELLYQWAPEGYKRTYEDFVRTVEDRKGHDLRYALDSSKLNRELGWSPKLSLLEGLVSTIAFYCGTKGKEWSNYFLK